MSSFRDPEPAHARRVLVVDDAPLVRGLLVAALTDRGFDARGAESAVSARTVVGDFDPDIALLDIDLGAGPTGLDLMSYLSSRHPAVAVVMMTDRPALATDVPWPEGVSFVSKSDVADPAELVAVIEATARGRAEVAPAPPVAGLPELTGPQREVLRLIALGYSNDRIAAERGVTRSGAEQAVGRLLRALGLPDSGNVSPRVEAARRYISVFGLPHP